MGLLDKIDKAYSKAYDKALSKLKRAPSSYTPVSKSALARQQIATKIAALTPALAATVLFRLLDGEVLSLLMSNPSFWRYFTVDIANLGQGAVNRQATKTTYEAAITIELGYPADQSVSVSGTVYTVADLKASDDEQIDNLLRGTSLWGSVTGAAVVRLESAFDVGNTVRRHRYSVHLERSW